MRLRRALPAIALVIASCTEPDFGPDQTGQLPLHLAWHLVTFDDAPLPAIVGTSFGKTERLLFESLHFTDSGVAWRASHYRLDSIRPGPEYQSEVSWEFRMTGPVLEIGTFYPCPGPCPPNDTAVLRGDSLIIEHSNAHGGGRRVYLPALEQ